MLFSQVKSITLENKIYNAIEAFVTNPSAQNLAKLELERKTFHPQTASETLACFTLENNLGFYQNQLGNTKKAISSYENAWRLYEKNKFYKYEVINNCLKPLGTLYTIIGDYDNAENTIKQYFYIANKQKNQIEKIAAVVNLCVVYQNTGRDNEAINLLERTLKTEKLSTQQKGNLLSSLGANYLFRTNTIQAEESDYRNAENSFLASISLLKNDASQIPSLSNSYLNLSKLKFNTDKKAAAFYLKKAKAEFIKIETIQPRKKAQFYYDEATLLLKQDKLKEASASIESVFKILIPNYSSQKTILPKKNSLYAENTLLDALDLQAILYLAQNQPKKALECYQLSFHIEALFQSLIVYENSKIVTQIRNRNRTEKCLEIYYALYLKENKISYIESAFSLQEKTKSAVLLQTLEEKKNISRAEKRILEQLQNWNTIIIKEQQKTFSADISKINEAIKKQNELMLLLKLKEFGKSKESKKEFEINELYSKLEKDKAVLVDYFYGNEKIYSFTIENRTIKIQVFEQEAADKLIFYSFLNCFKSANAITDNPKAYCELANAIYNILKLPNNKHNKNLIIIPDGILNFIPFEALLSQKSSTTKFSKMHYLLKDFAIGYTNSATFYLNTTTFRHKEETVLGIFPIFENSSLELTFSKKELENLKRSFKGIYLDNEKATFKNFEKEALNYAILHLSTHASSGDIVEPASIKFYDQEIYYSELYNLNINPDLVVLSACETGLGKLYKGEGAMSIARGFQFAGAQNLLFSLWKVNDFTTSVVMQGFYKNVKSGNSYFNANHQAKLDFLDDSSIPNAKKSPYYWSAFVYYGTLENKPSSNTYLFISIIGCTVVLGLVLLFLFTRRKRNNKL